MRCDRAFPDQFEESELVVVEFASDLLWQLKWTAGRSDGFVSFLGILDFGGVGSRRRIEERFAVLRTNQVAGCVDRFFGKRGRIGTHVSDVAVFVEALRHTHCVFGGHPELSIGFLLQGAGRKRRFRAFGIRFDFDANDFERSFCESGLESVG